MISAMREYFRGLKFIILIIIVAFIATSVVYFGTSALTGGPRPNSVATVNGEEIPAERFRRAQANAAEAYERMTKQRVTPELAERLGLNQQVIKELVTDAVIVQAAEREGIRVSDEELRARIEEMREFQEEGHFSRDRYMRVLRQVRFEAGEFEAELRRHLLRRKIEGLVKDGVKVSPAELRAAYAVSREQVRAAWAVMAVGPLTSQVTVADGDLEPYVKAHPAQFTRPERRRLQYVIVNPRLLGGSVSDADAEAHYKEHAAEFEQPRRLQIAHVLVRVPPVGGSAAEEKSRAKVEEVIKRARGGEDFAKLAQAISEDTANAAKGGDLGFVGSGELVPQFEQAAFALKKGEVSAAPVRTPFGYHAIKVLDVREGGRTPFKDVAAKIKDRLLGERSDAAARAKADEAKVPLQAAQDFTAEAQKLGLDVRDAVLARGEAFVGVGRDPRLDEALSSLAVGGVSSPVKTSVGYVVAKALAQFPAGVPPLAEIKDRVIDAVRRERAETLATDRAKALVASLAKGGDFLTTAKADGFETGETPFFSRLEPPKERVALPGGVLLAALQTPTGQVSEPVRAGPGVYVVKTLERRPADPQGFDQQRAELDKQVLEQKRNMLWESWVQARRAASKVEVAEQAASSTR